MVAYAKSQGIVGKVKGDKLIIDDTVYKHEDLDDLPHYLSMAKAKIIPASDGWAFQSHRAFPSNMYPSSSLKITVTCMAHELCQTSRIYP